MTRDLRFNTLSSVMLIVGSMIDELLRLACLPFLPTKLARLRCVLVSHCVELIRYGQVDAVTIMRPPPVLTRYGTMARMALHLPVRFQERMLHGLFVREVP